MERIKAIHEPIVDSADSQEPSVEAAMLPDEGEALYDAGSMNVGNTTVTRGGAVMWQRRPRPVEPEDGTGPKGSAINSSRAV